MASYVIGDLQGCYQELMQLLDCVKFDPEQDTLYLVGDLVARGPDSYLVAKLMLSLGEAVKPVLGNHDLHLLAIYNGLKKAKKSDYLDELLSSDIIDEYVEWLRFQPLVRVINLPNRQQSWVMSHAGWYPGWSLTQLINHSQKASLKLQSANYPKWLKCMYGNEPTCWHPNLDKEQKFRFTINACTRMRFISVHKDQSLHLDLAAKMAPDDAPDNLKPWFALQSAEMKQQPIIFGHWASLLGHTGQKNINALDTGCVWGNTMTCLRLDDNRLYIQPALV